MICGSISSVSLTDNTFHITTKDDYVFSHLTDKANFAILKRAFTWQDLPLDVVVDFAREVNQAQQDIDKLIDLAGDYLIIIGEQNNE